MSHFSVVKNPWLRYFLARDGHYRARGEGRFLKRPPRQPAWIREEFHLHGRDIGVFGVSVDLIEEIVINSGSKSSLMLAVSRTPENTLEAKPCRERTQGPVLCIIFPRFSSMIREERIQR